MTIPTYGDPCCKHGSYYPALCKHCREEAIDQAETGDTKPIPWDDIQTLMPPTPHDEVLECPEPGRLF